MKLKSFEKTYTGKHLNQYALTYENKDGKTKVYEMVSRSHYEDVSQIATHVDGVSIVALQKVKQKKEKHKENDSVFKMNTVCLNRNTVSETEDYSEHNQYRLLLLKEFRLGINKTIYNLCAGLKLSNESIEDCVRRELYEETGLEVKRIIDVLPPSYSAVAISDILTSIVFIEVDADDQIEDHTSANEEITAAFYNRKEVEEILRRDQLSSRAQGMAYFFSKGLLEPLY